MQSLCQLSGIENSGENGRKIDRLYLLRRWIEGNDAGAFEPQISPWHLEIWKMDKDSRRAKLKQWESATVADAIEDIIGRAHTCDASQYILSEALGRKDTGHC